MSSWGGVILLQGLGLRGVKELRGHIRVTVVLHPELPLGTSAPKLANGPAWGRSQIPCMDIRAQLGSEK